MDAHPLPRALTATVRAALADTPVVCLLGPRQCGKTTLARMLAPRFGYVSFDDVDALALARSDPNGFLAALPGHVILDEIQRVPELLRAIKLSVDRDRRPGRFLLTGSANLLLLPRLGDSLAGRMAVVELQPLAAAEQVNDNAMEAMDAIIREYELPAHTVGFGVKGAVTWSPTPIRNYRDYKLSTDFEAAELGWLWGINRGVLTPPGMDDQWLVSLAHTDADMAKWVDAFGELAKELRA